MPHFTRQLGTTHLCSLARGSDSCLPKLPPQASRMKKWIRNFRKKLMVSGENSNSKFFFRSRASIFYERRRHMRSKHPYIIHPFSRFCIKREIIVCILWMIAFVQDPFTTAFYTNVQIQQTLWKLINITVNALLLVDIFLCFITGTYKIQTKEVILEPKKIAIRYVKSFFFFDFFGTIPLNLIFYMPNERYEVYFTLVSCLHFVRFVRIKTALEYFRRITTLMGLKDTAHQLTCIIALSFYFLHWWTCMIYIIPKLHYGLSEHSLPNTSWVVMANIQPSLRNVTVTRRYIECMLAAFCHLYRSGVGMYITEEPIEQMMFSFVIISGIIHSSYIIVVVLQMVSSTNSSESKYEELVNQLEVYMLKKKLPQTIRRRLYLYYENRFQKHYFKEQAILNTLSDHLRYEIFLYSCKGLVEKVALFQGLSKATVGSIVGCLKHEVFLPNDVIMRAGGPADYIYFISFGTVAYIMCSGKELCHLEDGEYFGELQLLLSSTNIQIQGNAIAIETTEVFRLKKEDLQNIMYQDEEFADRLEKVIDSRLEQIENLEKEEPYDEGKHRRNVLYELRKGRILEHSHHKRRRDEKHRF